MTDLTLISREIDNLEKLACEIEESGLHLINSAKLNYKPDPPRVSSPFPKNHWEPLSSELQIIQRDAIRKYQKFYSAGLFFVKEFNFEKVDEFIDCYENKRSRSDQGVMDYLQFRHSSYSSDKSEIAKQFVGKFELQRSILSSIPFLIKIKEMNLREIISADFVEREIDESEYLFAKSHFRAAGALAGVALEQHLRALCDKYQIDYKKKDTIEPLVQKLYKNKKIDGSEMKKIQYLASIRDKCDHPSDINEGEVKELIEKVKKMI
ncbi:MAG: HEPN domain-containing protein [Methanomicrobiaceae archaeon]|nr:HEPN domain-containing protein [Methanomicrobiaceae archaeon]